MNQSASSVKLCCNREFTELFRLVLYYPPLTWGAKCLAFAMLDSPVNKDPKNAVLARKLRSHPQQVSIWRKELKEHGFIFREEKK